MKKLFFALSFFCALVSCTKELQSVNETEGTTETLFVGSSESVKVAVGDKEENVYKAVWSEGDQIYIIDATKQDLTVLGTADLVSGAGETSGTFSTKAELTDGAKVKIAYGITSIPAEQTQDASGAKDLTKITGAMSEEITLSLGGTNSFTLVHTPAIVKVNVSTSAFAGMNLESVMLYSKGAKLSGDGQTTGDYVCVTFKNPVASDKVQEAWFTTLPVATPTDFYAVATFKGTYNSIPGTTVTIPVKFTGKTLASNKVTSIPMTDLTLDSNTEASWYEPVEYRDLLGMWAYGPQNGYFIETKSTGDTTHGDFEVKARGNFAKVSKPKYYGFLAFSEAGSRQFCQIKQGGVNYYNSSHVGPDKVTELADGCKLSVITLKSTGVNNKGHFAVVAIYDENKNVLWSTTFYKYLTGDEVKEVAYPGTDIVLMDRILGCSSPEYGLKQGNLDIGAAYFQWGRKDPFMWSNSSLTLYTQTVVTSETTIEYAISHPSTIFGESGDFKTKWYVGDTNPNLWGAAKSSTALDANLVGHKTIFDPCPKGWRVMDDKVAIEVNAKAAMWEMDATSKHSYQEKSRQKTDSPFWGKASVLAYPLGGDKFDYWYYAGCHWGSDGNWGNRVSSNNFSSFTYYTNSCTSAGRAGVLMGVYFSKNWGTATDNKLADAMTIRCQKDEYGK